jgi:transposase-like protein
MARPRSPANPPCRHCGAADTVSNGTSHGHRQWRCRGCGRSFRLTTGTPLHQLHTPAGEVARALLVVMRRGSLRAAEEVTGHKYETIGDWLRRAAAHAEEFTDTLVHELQLSEVEIDEFWSFVRRKRGMPRWTPRTRALGSAGGA